ncbi:MAG: hypothetical protein IPJ19_05085 [Planctomycetes bacterium]|nr:hypothetical protein [Planctomycetota bacterium]
MRIALALAAALLAGCRSTAPSGAAHAGDAPVELRGDASVEAQLEIADARLEHVPGGVQAAFVLRNKSGSKLRFEFRVQAFGRAGVPLQGGQTAWVLLELGPHEGRPVRTAALPSTTESWRLVAR